MIAMPRKDALMAVPICILAVVDAIVHIDEAYARLDESTGQQHALPERVAAIAVAERVGLFGDVESLPDGLGAQECERFAVMLIDRAAGAAASPGD